jgi:hypothetical protein
MKAREPKQGEEPEEKNTELADLKKRLKKKELQTNILKKIIGQENSAEKNEK